MVFFIGLSFTDIYKERIKVSVNITKPLLNLATFRIKINLEVPFPVQNSLNLLVSDQLKKQIY